MAQFCTSCGRQIAENSRFCPICGAAQGLPPQAASGAPAPGAPTQYNAAPGYPPPAQGPAPVPGAAYPAAGRHSAPAAKKRTWILIVIIAVLAVALIVMGVLLLRGSARVETTEPGAAAASNAAAEPGSASAGTATASTGTKTDTAAGTPAAAAASEGGAAATPAPTVPPVPAKPLSIDVQQVDSRSFPEIRLYLRVEDSAGNVPQGLDGGFFYITRQQANGEFIRQKVLQVTQLDQIENLNIDMVADISGSMDGSPIREAKRVMQSFIQSVQFSAGDMVELTTFSNGVYINEAFCADAARLSSRISALDTYDMTALYDALYTAVNRVAAQNGAKCVMAFTDGKDNYSKCTAAQVIDLAQRYNVPIFIIGIGSVDESTLRNICQQTYGIYYNINSVGDLSEIYQQIYRQEKELYLVSYTDSVSTSASEASNITVGYDSAEFEGECSYHYQPRILLRVSDPEFYHSGPEAVVEKYIKGYAQAQTYSDFAYIQPYLLPGSQIYNEQSSYIKNTFSVYLDSFEIVSVDYSAGDKCIVTTLETFFVQSTKKPAYLMTQRCKYRVVNTGGAWYLEAFAAPVEVLSQINQ